MDAFLEAIAATTSWEDPDPDKLVQVFGGFVYIATQSGVFHSVYRSAPEFLQAQPAFNPYEAQAGIFRRH